MTTEPYGLLIGDLMNASGVPFGTSGLRGRVQDMTDALCYAYTCGFLQHLRRGEELTEGGTVGIAGDLRRSSPRIMEACAQAVRDLGLRPVCCGFIPTPALAAWGLSHDAPTLMVTGSHIPDDRNGIKFNTSRGEILKEDEVGIRAQRVELPVGRFDGNGGFLVGSRRALPEVDGEADSAYRRRYLEFFPAGCLAGLRVGLYEHSSVAREAFHDVLTGFGALVTRLGRTNRFMPVDTEAIRLEDTQLVRQWAATGDYDCLVSADGDGDRPLIADERGDWLRGDIAGILTARYLGAQAVVTPVSSNTALERSAWFPRVLRTRIGSPFVIAGMARIQAEGVAPVVGYEANGGFLLGSPLGWEGRTLAALPTRDALIVALGVLLLARRRGCPLSHLARDLPQRFTASDRLREFPSEVSQAHIAALIADRAAVEREFAPHFGPLTTLDTTDGLRMTFSNGEIVHLRPSGNAPELRAYTEADSAARAAELNQRCLSLLKNWRSTPFAQNSQAAR